MTGFTILLRKELTEAWRTRRLPVVIVLFVVIGMLSPLTARYLREIMQAALGDQLTVPIPTPTAMTAVERLQKNIGQLGALAAIALAMGSVAGELDRGTAALVLAQPVTRGAFLAAKLMAIAVVLGIAMLLAAAAAYVYTAVLFEPQPVGGWLAMTAPVVARPDGLGGVDLPRLGGHRLDHGRRGHRVRRADRALARLDRACDRSPAAHRPDRTGDPARVRW